MTGWSGGAEEILRGRAEHLLGAFHRRLHRGVDRGHPRRQRRSRAGGARARLRQSRLPFAERRRGAPPRPPAWPRARRKTRRASRRRRRCRRRRLDAMSSPRGRRGPRSRPARFRRRAALARARRAPLALAAPWRTRAWTRATPRWRRRSDYSRVSRRRCPSPRRPGTRRSRPGRTR